MTAQEVPAQPESLPFFRFSLVQASVMPSRIACSHERLLPPLLALAVLFCFDSWQAFFLLRKDDCNFFRDVASDTARELRQIMVSMVSAEQDDAG